MCLYFPQLSSCNTSLHIPCRSSSLREHIPPPRGWSSKENIKPLTLDFTLYLFFKLEVLAGHTVKSSRKNRVLHLSVLFLLFCTLALFCSSSYEFTNSTNIFFSGKLFLFLINVTSVEPKLMNKFWKEFFRQ